MSETESERTELVSLADHSDEERSVLFESGPKTVSLELAAGESVPPHQHPEMNIVFHLLSGTLDLELGAESHRLTAGDVARFDGEQEISPVAVDDSEALLVLARQP